MEGLTRLIKKAMEKNLFKGSSVNGTVSYDVVQFANDTFIVGEGNWGNLWCIKALIIGFELVSGLSINFFKSSICGVNLKPEFLEAASALRHCRIHSLPFKFLGIMVGDSLRKSKSWKFVFDHLSNRSYVWKGRNLSVGGRAVLINSVLNTLSVFSLSFYKAHAVVIKEIVKI
ncbi:uncharacterized protein LOC127130118 [Lathyrus oleraceus]|uniref:uncharacterized protein LOC127130118 n=1 Tax=Pisum sativum TaxID=3888 RepID=UPI0021D3C9A7|nr:uncharacterized protein LOC127130118 [Pisum sativum]